MGMAFRLSSSASCSSAVSAFTSTLPGEEEAAGGSRRWPRQLGMQYCDGGSVRAAREPFALFSKGDGRGIENVLTGPGRGSTCGRSTTGTTRRPRTGRATRRETTPGSTARWCRWTRPARRSRSSRENILTRLADALALHDIQFESEDFNKTFNVKSPDPKFANDLDRRADDAVAAATGKGTRVRDGRRPDAVLRRKFEPTEFITLLGTAKGFLEHVPRVVFSLYPSATRLAPEARRVEAAKEAGGWRAFTPTLRRNGGSASTPG